MLNLLLLSQLKRSPNTMLVDRLFEYTDIRTVQACRYSPPPIQQYQFSPPAPKFDAI